MLSYILKQFHSSYSFTVFIVFLDADLEDLILKYNTVPSNVPPLAPLDEFLRGVLEKHRNHLQIQEDNFHKKFSKNHWSF